MIRITDEQWALIEPHLSALPRRKGGRSRPWHSDRECLDGILWVLKTGAQWKAMPKEFPGYSTCWRRLRMWEEHDVWKDVWRAVLGALDENGLLEWEGTLVEATFVSAKKMGDAVGRTKRGKGSKLAVLVIGEGLPVGVQLAAANEGETSLAQPTVEEGARLAGDDPMC